MSRSCPAWIARGAIVQAGIIQVVVSSERMAQYSSAYYDEHFGMTEVLFAEAKVKVRRV